MKLLNQELGLYTDMYQLTMMQAYFAEGTHNNRASFDYFFRNIPFNGGYVVFAGLGELLDNLAELKFSSDDIDYLHSLKLNDSFLDYLKTFSFKGNIDTVEEGTIIFPVEPVLTVEGNLAEVQLIETLLLNTLNFNSLIATKASRMRLVADDKILSEFGLRRAQGLGGIQASSAAIMGGFDSTSNVFSGKNYDLEVSGTMAHSFIESFKDELSAFRKFAAAHPDNCVFLVDTYNTLKSGIPNTITVAKEMEEKGHKLKGIRLDSGDLAYLAKEARKMLDQNGLDYVKIAVSNQLDERVIKSLMEQQAPIDFFGVGTSLVTGHPNAALDGVFKLSMYEDEPRLKLSENITKTTLPGLKKVLRYTDDKGFLQADAVALKDETNIKRMIHPFDKERSLQLNGFKCSEINKPVMINGEIKIKRKSPKQIREKVKANLSLLPVEYKRFENPHIYKVGVSEKLLNLRDTLRSRFLNK